MVLRSWYIQFKDDPRMKLVAGLYKQCGGNVAGGASKQVSRRSWTIAAYRSGTCVAWSEPPSTRLESFHP